MHCVIFHNLLMTVTMNVRTRIPLDNYLTEEKFSYFSIRLPSGVLPLTRLMPGL